MITFKQQGKFEYQVLCGNNKPLYICLLPNNAISNKFNSVISSIQAMSETIGKVFDGFFFNLISDYQDCDNENARCIVLENNVKKTIHFSKVFVNLNYINYAKFADQGRRTKDSIFFDSRDIENFIKLSHALKIYSIVLNTEDGIDLENRRAIWQKFITLLKSQNLPSKLHKFLEILAINSKKNKIRDYSEKSEKKVDDDEDNIDNLICEAHNFILYEGLIIHDYKRNPIPFFVGILNTNIKYGGKYKPDNSLVFIDDDEVDKIEDKISKRESREKIKADNSLLNQLYRISLFYFSSAYNSTHRSKNGNQKYKKILEKIEYTSPFWNAILAPVLSKAIGMDYEKLREISPKQAAVISFYFGIKLNSIIKKKYQNLFRLAYLFPINSPDFRYYRLKSVSQFINAAIQFPITDLSPIGGSRIFIAKLIEDFIGKIKSTPFCSICTGHVINNIQTEKLEIETIDYIVRYFTNGFEEEIKEFETAIAEEFDCYKNEKNIDIRKRFLRKRLKYKNEFVDDKSSKKSNNNENKSKIIAVSKTDEAYYIKTNEFGRTYKYRKNSNLIKADSTSKNDPPASGGITGYRLKIKDGKIIKEDIFD